jgi:S-adenosylmethionine-diacylglycerol 3-amino-3-carboxypropyl transferase
MKENEKQQVELSKLVFTHNWEDPASDHAALRIRSGDSLMCITSGGCNAIGFLLFDPKQIYAVDINPAQSFVLELKLAAIRKLSYDDFKAFMGLSPCEDRLHLFSTLEPELSADALNFWKTRREVLKNGLLMSGKFERFIKMAGKFLTVMQGKRRIDGLLREKSLEEQHRYFDEIWNTRRFQYLFKILFNKRVLARRGLVADYFHFDDGSRSFAESFYNRSRKAFRNLPVADNYFLSLYLTGTYRTSFHVPEYLKKENYETIRSRVDRIKIITRDAQSWLQSIDDGAIDCFALSNICELMSEEETLKLFTEVIRTAGPQARIIFRNLMIPREVPPSLQSTIRKNESLSKTIFDNDRSFVYGKVAAYEVIR